ncbi:MAG: 50S ribosomal protein L20 [Pseudomonadota bacterium]|jgi:large subunit ribosomal protein L20
MTRSAFGPGNRRRHKKVLAMAKGYRGRAKSCFTVAIEKVEKGLQYQYRDRRNKKREFKSLWIQRINAGVRAQGMTYSTFIHACKKANIAIDRKVLAHLAAFEAEAFKAVVAQAKAAK